MSSSPFSYSSFSRLFSASPFRHSSFRHLFSAQVIALVGTGLTTVALTLLAYDLAGGNAGVVLGTAMAFKMVAYVIFSPILGGLAHRFPRKALLIILDVVRAATVLAMPFVTAVWQVYLLIFLLNLFSAGFKPVFAASIPDVLPSEEEYTKALSYSRLAYDLESLLSPLFAGLALLYFSYTALFLGNAVAFLISAVLIMGCVLPHATRPERSSSIWEEITFGLRSYMATPRLRALLTLYAAVAAASAMVIVNTVVFIRESMGLEDTDVALAFAAAGLGSMIAALLVPKALEFVNDRTLMIGGSVCMGVGLLLTSTDLPYAQLLLMWFFVGLGLSLVQTPAGRIVNRSSLPEDRPAYFSAQFALSHACWLIAYPVVGMLGATLGVVSTAGIMGGVVLAFTALAYAMWPRGDGESLTHLHTEMNHLHPHKHGSHHEHAHEGWEGPEPHVHEHRHRPIKHLHRFVIDDHHRHWPEAQN